MNSAREAILNLYNDYKENCKFLKDSENYTFLDGYNSIFIKTFLLSMASSFETEIKELLHKTLKTESSIILREFMNKKMFGQTI
ncbi:hypothetical protein MBAV_002987 [Candidatus Magnetobacterium bavaricum]|uniref:Uncharacterized protein n=1 Tax=Candidatus Magnetobacterium bavaricum TaxID=29290 RepID=A0A0F3GSN0_9BACT|nr:hypothetical protein MBAV_002987 [Candidatus Magnetobacterium bavaricum]